MRLIDSDKLENDIVENITVKAVSRMLAITQGQPTVKAIPIEWIEKQIEQYYDDGYNSYGKALNIMLADWKAENEAV